MEFCPFKGISPTQTVKYVIGLSKSYRSRRKFVPKRTNTANKNTLLHWGKNHTKENHYNKASNEKGMGLHICKAPLTPAGENKVGYWLQRDLRTTFPVSMWAPAPLGPNSRHSHRDSYLVSYLVGFHGDWGMRKAEKEVGVRKRNPIRIRRASPNLQQYNTDLSSNVWLDSGFIFFLSGFHRRFIWKIATRNQKIICADNVW